ncbi:hypothetical protein MMC18_003669 [Xylographa bjoerkii]|nr:hypothetical protein [Xylographa bjoerkii]
MHTQNGADVGDKGDRLGLPFCETHLGRLPTKLRLMIYEYALPVPLVRFSSQRLIAPVYRSLMPIAGRYQDSTVDRMDCFDNNHSILPPSANFYTNKAGVAELKMLVTCGQMHSEASSELEKRYARYLRDVRHLVDFVYRAGQARCMGCICKQRRQSFCTPQPPFYLKDLISTFLEKFHKDSWDRVISIWLTSSNVIAEDYITRFNHLCNELCSYKKGICFYLPDDPETEDSELQTLGTEIAGLMDEITRSMDEITGSIDGTLQTYGRITEIQGR